mmetsp:Transcript_22668/g.53653  ORF Transcript_22668/g.53653 Transcript_22668/m.53653 type:complete len:90 (+) Transcript_22668:305-574(+)
MKVILGGTTVLDSATFLNDVGGGRGGTSGVGATASGGGAQPTIYAAAVGAASTASGGGGGGAFDPRRLAALASPLTNALGVTSSTSKTN